MNHFFGLGNGGNPFFPFFLFSWHTRAPLWVFPKRVKNSQRGKAFLRLCFFFLGKFWFPLLWLMDYFFFQKKKFLKRGREDFPLFWKASGFRGTLLHLLFWGLWLSGGVNSPPPFVKMGGPKKFGSFIPGGFPLLITMVDVFPPNKIGGYPSFSPPLETRKMYLKGGDLLLCRGKPFSVLKTGPWGRGLRLGFFIGLAGVYRGSWVFLPRGFRSG